jgi:3-deoxy-D-manno-octulosonic-acid transferase
LSFFFYNILVPIAWLLLHGPGFLFPRLRENIRVRRQLFVKLEKALQENPPHQKKRAWMHCASMGEFEAIRPLARLLRSRGYYLCISFLSTSGPKHLQGAVEADIITYHPFDTLPAAKRFVKLLKPDLLLVTKHDLWPNHLRAARSAGAKLLFINANFHSKSRLTLPFLRGFHRATLSLFHLIAPVSELTAKRFEALCAGLSLRIEPLGDARYDRVIERAMQGDCNDLLPSDFQTGPLLVAGSTWPAGEKHLLPAFKRLMESYPESRLLLVPHEPKESQLLACEARLKALDLTSIRLSEVHSKEAVDRSVLLVDRVGLLASLYRVGLVAYVGGGFTTGVHSVIEPAAHSLPVLFGPSHHVSQEADYLLEQGGAQEIRNQEDAYRCLHRFFSDEQEAKRCGQQASALVKRYAGASEEIFTRLQELDPAS